MTDAICKDLDKRGQAEKFMKKGSQYCEPFGLIGAIIGGLASAVCY